MEDREHHIQDASELYAVAVLQRLAEDAEIAITRDSDVKFAAFHAYAEKRGLTSADFSSGNCAGYKSSVDAHMPDFLARLRRHWGDRLRMDFTDCEAAYRNLNKKADFIIELDDGREFPVSLKNYRKSAARPQVCSGTFNSFIINFLFEPAGVGWAIDPETGRKFLGSNPISRDAAVRGIGLGDIVPLLHQLDGLNTDIKRRFVYGDDFEFLDEERFDVARKECGRAGSDLALQILEKVGEARVKTRLLKMTGLDGTEEVLLLDPVRFADSITNPEFMRVRFGAQDPSSRVEFERWGQGIRFVFRASGGAEILTVHVPFTINKNGAWISGTPYDGLRVHAKEGIELAYGQRRPKKSKELATSVNTYVEFEKAGVFVAP